MDECLIAKKDARILWNTNAKGQITSLIVREFKENNKGSPFYHYDSYKNDIGNCLANWNDWSVPYIIFYILGAREFVDNDVRAKACYELRWIKEIRDVLPANLVYRVMEKALSREERNIVEGL